MSKAASTELTYKQLFGSIKQQIQSAVSFQQIVELDKMASDKIQCSNLLH